MAELYQPHPDERESTLIEINGILDQNLIDELILNAESILKNSESDIKIRKKVFSILVEIVQNIYQYSHDVMGTDESEVTVEFTLRKSAKGYQIVSRNTISEKSIPLFRKKLEKVNRMDKKSLRKKYLDILANGKFSSSGGAGVGLMHIARNSGKKINYNFSQPTQDQSFFSLEVNVSA
ncbi:MAG: SiaB family protein kinase [Cyclobacteriaceae bacterium]